MHIVTFLTQFCPAAGLAIFCVVWNISADLASCCGHTYSSSLKVMSPKTLDMLHISELKHFRILSLQTREGKLGSRRSSAEFSAVDLFGSVESSRARVPTAWPDRSAVYSSRLLVADFVSVDLYHLKKSSDICIT